MDGEITPERLRERREAGDEPLLVDIRDPASFDRGHIPGSRNVPLQELPNAVETVADAEHVVTVCPHGKASVKAARLVAAYGEFEGRVESLAGGLEAWDGPLERADVEDDGDRPDAPF